MAYVSEKERAFASVLLHLVGDVKFFGNQCNLYTGDSEFLPVFFYACKYAKLQGLVEGLIHDLEEGESIEEIFTSVSK